MELSEVEALRERYHRVKDALPSHVKLIVVSKKRTVDEIKALYDLGHRSFGESYPQELRDKHPLLPPDIEWHFIGNLQANKAKYVAPIAGLVHTVDGTRILDELNKRATTAGRKLPVLIQVHIAREETKHGLSPEETEEFFNNWDPYRWPSIVVRGLMGMATNTDDQAMVLGEFIGLKGIFDRIRGHSGLDPTIFSELSMGMSDDVELAIQAGSTMVRIGTSIFGER